MSLVRIGSTENMPLNRKIKRFINDCRFGACAEKLINGLTPTPTPRATEKFASTTRNKAQARNKDTRYQHTYGKSGASITRKIELQ